MIIFVVKIDSIRNIVEEGQLHYLASEEVGAGRRSEKGYVIRTDAILHGVPQYNLYNQFMMRAAQEGFSSVFFNY